MRETRFFKAGQTRPGKARRTERSCKSLHKELASTHSCILAKKEPIFLGGKISVSGATTEPR